MSDRRAQQRPGLWAARAGVVERAIYTRHLRRLWGLPGTLLGVVSWPASVNHRGFGHWHYWWQAHLLDCLVDAQLRFPTGRRRTDIHRLVRGIRRRNLGSWTNDFYDDGAWLGIALLRAHRHAGVDEPAATRDIAARLREGWTDHSGGGIWWRRNDNFKNVPANGPAAIMLARLSADETATGGDRADRQRARSTVDWMEDNLLDPATGLLWDGLRVAPDGTVRSIEKTIYTYCQGVFLGACVELSRLDGPVNGRGWALRAARTINAVADHVTVTAAEGPVLRGQGGGDGGLFAGILARYLAVAAIDLPPHTELDDPRRTAARLVFASAEAAWRNRTIAPGGPLFGPEWAKPAVLPNRSARPERDLSVQLGAWMLLEAAAALEDAGVTIPASVD